jgi:ferredoxin-NADP reductase
MMEAALKELDNLHVDPSAVKQENFTWQESSQKV